MTTPRDPIEAPATDWAAVLRGRIHALIVETSAKDSIDLSDYQILDKALAAARDEGRQEAVRDYRALIEWLPSLIDGRDRAGKNHLIRAAIDDGRRILEHQGHRILVNGHGNRWCHDCEAWAYFDPGGVAGFNASESPRPLSAEDRAAMAALSDQWDAETRARLGDASESPPTHSGGEFGADADDPEDMDALAIEQERDASESGHREVIENTDWWETAARTLGDARRFAALMETDALADDRFADASESDQPKEARDE